ncbi:hypothetical protein MKQ70_07180 [Chitinophaga sedimenti]|uniref:glycosyl hydrolase family 28-related protein n=1 Tax=Chitinophaga sedimenti TaxID=2033606 RepID=UPI002004504E|nr:glycosyl hydrolase family 28-related protein [Chitinophaga sedimenti]MCK7554795.1 hypothetical protein [Chitinophaga sedimenti]
MRLHFSILSIAMAAAFHVQPVAAQYSWNNLPVVQEPVFRKDTFNILRYGAKADGLSLNSDAINKAITAASQRGGGVVLVPAGLWLTGPVVLKSNVELHLAKSALLQFTKDFDQYPLIETYYEGLAAVRCQAPVSAVDAENIAITGSGIIDGGGDAGAR